MNKQSAYKRQAPRVRVSPPVKLLADGKPVEGRLHDLSVNGAGVMVDEDMAVGTAVTLEISGVGSFRGKILRAAGPLMSISFDRPTPQEREAIADYLQVFKVMYGGSR